MKIINIEVLSIVVYIIQCIIWYVLYGVWCVCTYIHIYVYVVVCIVQLLYNSSCQAYTSHQECPRSPAPQLCKNRSLLLFMHTDIYVAGIRS